MSNSGGRTSFEGGAKKVREAGAHRLANRQFPDQMPPNGGRKDCRKGNTGRAVQRPKGRIIVQVKFHVGAGEGEGRRNTKEGKN